MRTFVLIALVLGAWSAPALACVTDPCGPAVRTFGDGVSVPGNLVYFKLHKDNAKLALVTADGAAIPASVRTIGGDKVFAPDQPIAPGQRVRLRWSYRCAELGRDLEDEYTFKTEAHAVPLTGQAKLEIIEEGLRPYSNRHRRPTDWKEGYVDLQLSWTKDDELWGVHGHLFEISYKVDGKSLSPGLSRLVVRTPCERAASTNGSSCGDFDEFPPGTHTVTTTGHIIGTDISLDSSLEVRTACDGVPPPVTDVCVPAAPDAALRDAGKAALLEADGGARKDAGPRPGSDDVQEEQVEPAKDGCRLARGRFDAAYLALGLALLLRRKRQ